MNELINFDSFYLSDADLSQLKIDVYDDVFKMKDSEKKKEKGDVKNNRTIFFGNLDVLPNKIWMAIDFETIDDFSLRLFCKTDPIQIGFVIYNFDDDVEIFRFGSYIRPKNKFNFANTSKIKWHDVENAPTFEDMKPMLNIILKKCEFIVAHNYPSELGVLKGLFPNLNIKIYDTLFSSRRNFKDNRGNKLYECCQRLNIECGNCHNAIDDAIMTAKVFLAMKNLPPYIVIVDNGTVIPNKKRSDNFL